jgi:hypothetical protein
MTLAARILTERVIGADPEEQRAFSLHGPTRAAQFFVIHVTKEN